VLLDVALPMPTASRSSSASAHPKIAKLPVIMMTGKSEPRRRARPLAHADGYVTKPFKISALISARRDGARARLAPLPPRRPLPPGRRHQQPEATYATANTQAGARQKSHACT
jgi:DNA-binding response OmpR family regulator